jgi:hypothetical protein
MKVILEWFAVIRCHPKLPYLLCETQVMGREDAVQRKNLARATEPVESFLRETR